MHKRTDDLKTKESQEDIGHVKSTIINQDLVIDSKWVCSSITGGFINDLLQDRLRKLLNLIFISKTLHSELQDTRGVQSFTSQND